MKKGLILVISILILSLIIIANNYEVKEEDGGVLNNLKGVFSFKLLGDLPLKEGYGYGSDKCGEECVDRYSCLGENVGLEVASCDKGKCVYSDAKVFEECGVCEKCIIIENSLSSEKPSFKFIFKGLKNLEDLSAPVEKIVLNYFIGDWVDGLYGVGIIGLMIAFAGQQDSTPVIDDGNTGDILIKLFDNHWFGQPKKGENDYTKPTCLSDLECERDKNICSETSNEKEVMKSCSAKIIDEVTGIEKNNPIYSCMENGGLCKTQNFIIKEINGIPPLQAKQDCCSWAWKLEFEKCKNEVNLGIKKFTEIKLKGGDYNDRGLTGSVIINIQNTESSSSSKHSGYTNTLILTGSRDEISQKLIPGESARFVLTKAFNKFDWTPPWFSYGLKQSLSENRCSRCDDFKKLVENKDSIDLIEILSEGNDARYTKMQKIVGAGFVQFLLSHDKGYVEKNFAYQRLILQFLFQGYENKNKGYRTYHPWEKSLMDKEYGYGFKDIKEAENEFKKWIDESIQGVNPCNCLTSNEVENGIDKSPC